MVRSTVCRYWFAINLNAHLVIGTHVKSHFDRLCVDVTHPCVCQVKVVCNRGYLELLTDWSYLN